MLIPPKVFLLHKAATKESCRYALKGIHFERAEDGTPYAVASDGRRLVAVTWTEWNAEEYPYGVFDTTKKPGMKVIVPVDDCREAPKLNGAGSKSHLPALHFIGLEETSINGTVKLVGTDLERKRTLEPRAIDGAFPDWRAVVPNYAEEDAVRIVLNPEYLAEIAQLASAIACTDRAQAIRLIVPKDPTRPIVIEAKDGEGTSATAVLMPLAKDTIPGERPKAFSGITEATPTEEAAESEVTE